MHFGARPRENSAIVNAQYVWKSLRIKRDALFQTLVFYGGSKILSRRERRIYKRRNEDEKIKGKNFNKAIRLFSFFFF